MIGLVGLLKKYFDFCSASYVLLLKAKLNIMGSVRRKEISYIYMEILRCSLP